jgi:hypothetical protein
MANSLVAGIQWSLASVAGKQIPRSNRILSMGRLGARVGGLLHIVSGAADSDRHVANSLECGDGSIREDASRRGVDCADGKSPGRTISYRRPR